VTRYCVGHESDPETVRKAVKGLRMLARLGKRAERALAAMERGEDFGPVVWLGRPEDRLKFRPGHDRRYIGDGLESFCLNRAGSLTKFRGVSREDLPNWEELDVKFGKLDEEDISKNTVRFFQLRLSGFGLHCRDGKILPLPLVGPGCVIGDVRLKSDGSLSLSPQYHVWTVPDDSRRVIRIPSNGKVADKTMARIANVVAMAVIRGPYSWREEAEYPQELMELRKLIPSWLLEDGMIQCWVDRVRKHAASIRAVADVMEG